MRYYKTKYELSVYNWFMIQVNGLDLNYLLKRGKIRTDKQRTKLYKVFEDIVHSLKFIKNDVLRHRLRWQSQLTQLKIKQLIKDNKPLPNFERVFRDYLEALQRQYTEFSFTVFRFNKNYRELMKKFTEHMTPEAAKMCMELLQDFEEIEFFDWYQYNMLIYQEKYLVLLPLTMHPDWIKEFIVSKERSFAKVVGIDSYLLQIFEEHQMYDEYQQVRIKLFDLSNLDVKTEEAADPFESLAHLGAVLGFDIDAKKTSLAKYEGYLESARKKIEANKPEADRNGS